MKKTKWTKSLAFQTILRLFLIILVISLIASAVIGAVTFYSMVMQMRDDTYEAALKGISIASSQKIAEHGFDQYLESGETDEDYDDLWLNLLLITDDYGLHRCDIFVPHEDHIAYLMSTEDNERGESLNKEEPYYGDEKKYVDTALGVFEGVDTETIMNPDNLAWKIFYTENVKDGVDVMTCYMPVYDSNNQVTAILAVSQSSDKVGAKILQNILSLIGISLGVMIVSVILFFFSIRKRVIKPVTKLTAAVRTLEDGVKAGQVIKTDIHTGDEIEELAVAFEEMNRDLIGYIDENTKITAERERLDTELSLATNIQAGMLPAVFPAFPDRKDFDIYASMKPAKEVGGDFYDFFLIDDDHIGLVMADVSGKGVPAALFMMYAKILLKSYTLMKQSPKAALEEVNRQICSSNPEDMFVTVWLGVLDLKTGELTAANAGHEKPAIMQPGGRFELYQDKHGMMVGYLDGIRFKEYTLTLEKGAKFFLYTDGVAEATNAKEELFGTERMIEALRTAEDKSPQEILEAVDNAVNAFVGEAPQFDDLTMLCIEYKEQDER